MDKNINVDTLTVKEIIGLKNSIMKIYDIYASGSIDVEGCIGARHITSNSLTVNKVDVMNALKRIEDRISALEKKVK